jgi:hypothetical protein
MNVSKNISACLRRRSRYQRRGGVAVYVLVSAPLVIGFGALAVDIGMLYSAQAEIQRTADAAALASAAGLLGDDRILGGSDLDQLIDDARELAAYTAGANPLIHLAPIVDPLQDVDVGYVPDLDFGSSDMVIGGPELPNAIAVRVWRDSGHGGSIALFFARFLGADEKDLGARATAGFQDGIVGYEVTETSGNADVLPFSLHVNSWSQLQAGTLTTGDEYGYDEESGTVTVGPDGIKELNLFPGAGADQLPPGNFGTVDIGSPDNSAADLARQILYGISAEDLAYFGGRLEFGADGTLVLNGDTGISAGMRQELDSIKGQERSIPLFSHVEGNGNNAMFTIVRFVGIRILNVQLTGRMANKQVIIQPAVVVDDAAIPGSGSGQSEYVYRPVQLIR